MNINLLEKQLSNFKIDFSQWNHDRGTKTVAELNHEIEAGETTLEIIDGKLFRIVKLISINVQIKLGNELFILVEDKQIFFTGAVRKRGLRNLAEKIKNKEKPEQTVIRALKEEISLTTNKKPIFREKTQESKTSPSYPQLDSIYQIWNYSITLDEEDLAQIKFSEYQKKESKIILFSLEKMN